MNTKNVLRLAACGLASWVMAAPALSAGWALTDLGTLGGANSVANGLNNAGQVVGYAEAADGTPYPVMWSGGVGGGPGPPPPRRPAPPPPRRGARPPRRAAGPRHGTQQQRRGRGQPDECRWPAHRRHLAGRRQCA